MSWREPVRSTEDLRQAIRRGYSPEFLFFWGHRQRAGGMPGKSCLSQWWPSRFTLEGVRYPSAEHYMMAEKARLFRDFETLERILRAPGPEEAKQAGRQVRGFDGRQWDVHRIEFVVRGNLAKFSQNETLRAFLLNTGERVLAEASPLDCIWGIGLAESDPRAQDPERWPGLNLLGFALMEVRSLLVRGEKV